MKPLTAKHIIYLFVYIVQLSEQQFEARVIADSYDGRPTSPYYNDSSVLLLLLLLLLLLNYEFTVTVKSKKVHPLVKNIYIIIIIIIIIYPMISIGDIFLWWNEWNKYYFVTKHS